MNLTINDLSLWFGGVRALTDINLEIRKNEILAIIGPNGAGKTCLLNCINGFYKPQQGEIYLRRQAHHPHPARQDRPGWGLPGPSRISSFTPG